MKMIDIITKKKNKQALTIEEIEYALNGYVNEEIPDYQMSALLMSIVLNGMNEEETIALTKVMIDSGDVISVNPEEGIGIDKHSTGGVGDKTTLIISPIVAACGVSVAKMSGRGLGHTGGTLDKLESIPGYQIELTKEQFIKQVNEIGIAVASQTGNLVPADKKIYALRDVTGTTESLPLIASSIMSKKIATGASAMVIDVKVGNGALMKDIDSAKELANIMIKIGKAYGRKVVCILSNMEEPLGYSVGNGLEVEESIKCLQNEASKDLLELSLTLASYMVHLGKDISIEEARKEVEEVLSSGKALVKMQEWITYQGGNINNIIKSERVVSIKSKESGFIEAVDTTKLGELAKQLGAGRNTKDEEIDYGVGFVLSKKVGDFVLENEEILKVYIGKKDIAIKDILSCFTIGNHAVDKQLILDILM